MTTTELRRDIDLTRKTEKAKATRWKQRWLFTRAWPNYCTQCGARYDIKPGDELVVCCVDWPSKESADDDAAEDAAVKRAVGARYVGAFPVEASS